MTRKDFDPEDDARLAALRRYTVLLDEEASSFTRFVEVVRRALDVPMATVSIVEFDRQVFKAAAGMPMSQTPRDASFCSIAVRTGEPLAVEDTHADARFADNPLVTGAPFVRAYLGVPLTTPDGFNIGALCALDRAPRRFERREIELMTDLARLVVGDIALRQVAHVDALTGALTRSAFVSRLERAVAAAPEPAALALLDVDRFAQIADVNGYRAGDAVLAGLARHVLAWRRPEDAFGRMGGTEFAVLMRGSGTVEALRRLEALRAAVEKTGVDAPVRMEVTTSIGLAPLTPGTRTVSAWLHAADKALYEAKVYGRNRVVLGDGEGDAGLRTPSGSGDGRRMRDLPVEGEILSPLEVMRWVNKVH